LDSLQEIGRVSVPASGGGTINTSAASIEVISGQSILDQGFSQVTRALNEIPGIVTTADNFSNGPNGALPNHPQIPQIRGGLPYETASLIDGHAIPVGSQGYFTPIVLNPYLLQSIEVVKGPGAMPDEITNAINGTVNYRTLEPTRNFVAAVDFDYNSYGGLSSNYKLSGTTTDGRLGYVADYGVFGLPGPVNQTVYGNTLAQAATSINGQPICGSNPPGSCLAGAGPPAYPPNVIGGLSLGYPLIMCCDHIQTAYDNHYYLGKLTYALSPVTSIETSYLGGRQFQDLGVSYDFGAQYFLPPAGYTGSIPSGFQVPYGTLAYDLDNEATQQGLFQAQMRTSVGKDTLLLRYYAGAQQDFAYNYWPNQTYTWNAKVWGGLPLGPGGTEEFFNGQTATFTQNNGFIGGLTDDHFSGYSGEYDIPAGNDLFTVSLDRTLQTSFAESAPTIIIPKGASQAFTTLLLRGTFVLSPQVTMTLGNYFLNYSTHFTPDGGATWANASHDFYGPRFAMTYQPLSGTSFRASAGSSIAPPFLQLVNTAGGPPIANNEGAPTYYTQLLNNGSIAPETAFGIDLGADHRFPDNVIVSGDLYQTNLHGQYFTSAQTDGTYTATSGFNIGKTLPLFLQEWHNLGQSTYEGAELSVQRAPSVGFGFVAQGALMRAYTFNLPANFYATGAGPFTTNLAILPYVNYYGSGNGYNGAAPGRMPYSQGYAALNFRTTHGMFAQVGATYYGPNNPYNAPAFLVYNASLRFTLAPHTTLQVSGDNILGALSSSLPGLFTGVPEPLAITGLAGATSAGNLGPPIVHVVVHREL
jgi:hypothetical protein